MGKQNYELNYYIGKYLKHPDPNTIDRQLQQNLPCAIHSNFTQKSPT